MAEKIKALEPAAQIELIGGGRGDFIVVVDGEEVWNKNASGRGFPDEEDLADEICARDA